MKRVGQFFKEYAIVLAAIFLAGMIMGGCVSLPPEPPSIRWNQNDPPPVKEMPNWIESWDHSRPRPPRCA